MEVYAISLLNGVSYGLLLFLLSSGLTLIFSMMGVLNFAHASFYMLGAYFAYSIASLLGFWPALVLAPLLTGVLGALSERYLLRRVHRFGHVAELLITFGLGYVILELVQLVWGHAAVDYRVPQLLDSPLFTLFGARFPAYRGFMMLVAVLVLLILRLVLARSRIGLVIQASLTHPDMVEALGHNVPRLFMLVFGGGCALAGLAGVIGGNTYVTEPGMAMSLGGIVFVVVVVGGMGSLTGALMASLLIGILQTLAVAVDASLLSLARVWGISIASDGFTDGLLRLKLSQLAPLLPYLVLVLMLVFRPRGLLGARELNGRE
jgi:branched-chain amino acid transport system permease protein